MLKPSTKLPSFSSVWLPDVMRLNDNVQPAGQTGGFLGKRWDPERVICDPSSPQFRIEGLALPPELPPLRLSVRQSLLSQVDRHLAGVERGGLLEDHDRRGLLDETLVVAIGEFGRTPKINANGGRDHWGHVFSFVLAGAGIRAAQVIGSSDRNGAYPKTAKMEPQDLTATLFHLLGIGH